VTADRYRRQAISRFNLSSQIKEPRSWAITQQDLIRGAFYPKPQQPKTKKLPPPTLPPSHVRQLYRFLDQLIKSCSILTTVSTKSILKSHVSDKPTYQTIQVGYCACVVDVNTPVEVIKALDNRLLISHNGIDYQTQFVAY
jgi:hypothetical protein